MSAFLRRANVCKWRDADVRISPRVWKPDTVLRYVFAV